MAKQRFGTYLRATEQNTTIKNQRSLRSVVASLPLKTKSDSSRQVRARSLVLNQNKRPIAPRVPAIALLPPLHPHMQRSTTRARGRSRSLTTKLSDRKRPWRERSLRFLPR